MILGDDGPAIAELSNARLAGVDHRLHGENHARLQLQARACAAVVQHLWLFVELPADPMTAELTHDREAVLFRMRLDRLSDVTQVGAGSHRTDAEPHALVGDVGKPPRLD